MKILKLSDSITLDISALVNPILNEDIEIIKSDFLKNRIEIIEASNSIENKMKQIIKFHFLGFDSYSDFDTLVLDQPWFTFHNKKKLIQEIIETHGYIEGKVKDKLIKQLSKIIDLRNLVTHGKMILTEGHNMRVEGMKGKKYSKTFDENYLNEIEKLFNDGNSSLHHLMVKIDPKKSGRIITGL